MSGKNNTGQILDKLIEAQKVLEERVKAQKRIIDGYKKLEANGDIFFRIIESFPYPMVVFSSDGSFKLGNKAFFTAAGINEATDFLKNQSIHNTSLFDRQIIESIKKAISGETISLSDLNDPFNRLREKTSVSSSLDGNGHIFDALFFPITDTSSMAIHVVCMFIEQKT